MHVFLVKCIIYLSLERPENFNDIHHKIATIYSLKLLVTSSPYL